MSSSLISPFVQGIEHMVLRLSKRRRSSLMRTTSNKIIVDVMQHLVQNITVSCGLVVLFQLMMIGLGHAQLSHPIDS
jgi:hypothetical protein